MIGIKLDGLQELNNALGKLPKNVENRVLQNAVTSSARIARKKIADNAPRDADGQSQASKKYGRLFKNIKVRNSRRDRRNGQRGAYITTGNAFWGYFLEKGTRFISPKPWFLPAFTASANAMIENLKEKLQIGIEKEWDKLV